MAVGCTGTTKQPFSNVKKVGESFFLSENGCLLYRYNKTAILQVPKKKQQFAVLLFKSKKGRGKIFLRMSVCWNFFLAFVFLEFLSAGKIFPADVVV